jgi:hypothetical protein
MDAAARTGAVLHAAAAVLGLGTGIARRDSGPVERGARAAALDAMGRRV